MEYTFQGTEKEFEAIIEKHKSSVYGTIYAYIQWNSDADDIAQEVFIHAYCNFGKLNDESKLGAWLCGIARNMSLKKLRSTRFHISLEQIQTKMHASNPETDFIRYETKTELHNAVKSLSKPVAETISLFYFSGKSIREISNLLSVPEGTIKSRLHDGRKKLKGELIHMMKDMGAEKSSAQGKLEKQVSEVIKKTRESSEAVIALAFDHEGENGIEYFKEAYEIALSVEYYAMCSECAFWIGANYIYLMEFDKGGSWIELALEMYNKNTDDTSCNICDGDFFRVPSLAKSALASMEALRERGRLEKGYVSLDTFCEVLHLYGDEIRCLGSYGWDISGTQRTDYRLQTEKYSLCDLFNQSLLMPDEYKEGTVKTIDEYGDNGFYYTIKYEIVSDSDIIETPAGTFSDCIHLVTTEYIPDYNPDDEQHRDFYSGMSIRHMWYAKNIGCIKGSIEYPNSEETMLGSFVLSDYNAAADEKHPYFPLAEGNTWKYQRIGCADNVRISDRYTVDTVRPDSVYIGKTGWRYIED